jgi:hypothetical protein
MEYKLTEFEQLLVQVIKDNIETYSYYFDENAFIKDFRQIMPSTCTENERKFLDRVRADLVYDGNVLVKIFGGSHTTIIDEVDFPDIDLKALVEETKKLCPLCDEPYDSEEHELACQLYGGEE